MARALTSICCLVALGAASHPNPTTLKTIETPSRFVDPADVTFNGDDHPGELRARVLLPAG